MTVLVERQIRDQSVPGFERLPEDVREFAQTFYINPDLYRDIPEPALVAALATSQIYWAETIDRKFNDVSLSHLPLRDGLELAGQMVKSESPEFAEAGLTTRAILKKLKVEPGSESYDQFTKMMHQLDTKTEKLITDKAKSYAQHSRRGDSERVLELAPFFSIFGINVTAPSHTLISGDKAADAASIAKNTEASSRALKLITLTATAMAATVIVTTTTTAEAADFNGSHGNSHSAHSQNVNPLDAKSSTWNNQPDPNNTPSSTTYEQSASPDTSNSPQGEQSTTTPPPDSSNNSQGEQSTTTPSPDASSTPSPETSPDNTVPQSDNQPKPDTITIPDVSVNVSDNGDNHHHGKQTDVNIFDKLPKSDNASAPDKAPDPAAESLDPNAAAKEAKKAEATLAPTYKTGVENIANAIKTRSLNAFSLGEGDLFATKDPSGKLVPLKMSDTDYATISALSDQMDLVLAHPDDELLGATLDANFADMLKHMDPQLKQAITSASKMPFGEQDKRTPEQRQRTLLLSYTIANIARASAEPQIAAAQAKYKHDHAPKVAPHAATEALNPAYTKLIASLAEAPTSDHSNFRVDDAARAKIHQAIVARGDSPQQEELLVRLINAAVPISDKLQFNPANLVARVWAENGGKQSNALMEVHNLFSIKAPKDWKGKTIVVPTWEIINGQRVDIEATFIAFDTDQDCIDYMVNHVLQLSWYDDMHAFYRSPEMTEQALMNTFDGKGNLLQAHNHGAVAYSTAENDTSIMMSLIHGLALDQVIPADYLVGYNYNYMSVNGRPIPSEVRGANFYHVNNASYFEQSKPPTTVMRSAIATAMAAYSSHVTPDTVRNNMDSHNIHSTSQLGEAIKANLPRGISMNRLGKLSAGTFAQALSAPDAQIIVKGKGNRVYVLDQQTVGAGAKKAFFVKDVTSNDITFQAQTYAELDSKLDVQVAYVISSKADAIRTPLKPNLLPNHVPVPDAHFVFPLDTTKYDMKHAKGMWCWKKTTNCHHDYNAADLAAPAGTPVIAAMPGKVAEIHDHSGSKYGSNVTVINDDGTLIFYNHLGNGTVDVKPGQRVEPGDVLGAVGTAANAAGTMPHLHVDMLPKGYSYQPICAGPTCKKYPYIDVQQYLSKAFQQVPEGGPGDFPKKR